MSQYLDKAARYDFYFAKKCVETINSAAFLSHDFFHSCIKAERDDSDMNPLEDYVIVVHYFNGTPVKEISQYIDRSERAVSLRLRLLFDIRNCLFFNPVGKNDWAIDMIIEGFRTRMMFFRDYCEDLVVINEITSTFDEEDICQEKADVVKNTFRFS